MNSSFFNMASLADVEAIEAIPLSKRDIAENVYAIFQRSAKLQGDKIALRFLFMGKADESALTYSYNELLKRITQAANAFADLGSQQKNVVSLLLPNLPQTHFAQWGAEATAISNPINPMLETDLIIEIMNSVKTSILVTLAPFPNTNLWEKAQIIAQKVPSLKVILTVNLAQFLPESQRKLMTQEIPAELAGKIKIKDFDQTIAQYRSDQLERNHKPQPTDVVSYFHTGGTTGAPKIAIHTQRNHVFNAWIIAKLLQWQSQDVILCAMPLFHVTAPFVLGLGPFTAGAEVLLTSPQGFRSETVVTNFWNLIQRYRVSFFMAVPTTYTLLNHVPINNCDVSSLKFAICGASPMPKILIKEFEQRTGLKILEGYGLTEGNGVSSVNPPCGERLCGSIGLRIPYQPMKTVVIDENGNYIRDCNVNEIGTIVIKGPNRFQGYLDAKYNDKVWLEDDWFNTGDLARQDQNGYFWLTGRSKDLIIRSGHNIDPQLIEEPLHQHPAIASVAAVGKPDIKAGELPVAYVTLREGQKITSEELLTYLAEKISERAALPKNIFILDKLPQTAVGKIFKPALRYDAIKRVFTEALSPLGKAGTYFDIEVKADVRHGQIAIIEIPRKNYSSEFEQKIRTILANYPIAIDIVVKDELEKNSATNNIST